MRATKDGIERFGGGVGGGTTAAPNFLLKIIWEETAMALPPFFNGSGNLKVFSVSSTMSEATTSAPYGEFGALKDFLF